MTPATKTEWRQNIGGRELRRENFVQIFAQRTAAYVYMQTLLPSMYFANIYVCQFKNNSRCALQSTRYFYPYYYDNQPLHFGPFVVLKYSS